MSELLQMWNSELTRLGEMVQPWKILQTAISKPGDQEVAVEAAADEKQEISEKISKRKQAARPPPEMSMSETTIVLLMDPFVAWSGSWECQTRKRRGATMFSGMFMSKPDKEEALKQLRSHVTMFGIWVAAIRVAPYVLHYFCDEKEELKLDF
ncbi:hypothetical protein SAY87_020919 [Trapa incisa]|uniref:Mitochondrial import receptor subunit TOM6 homolog n=1 Tax=Trapa incisa TaxID=236973 RepID=A0AAN7JR31_9MYRT|nr:hypothetical protein SAY87_020919 [Trapa incisa]